MMSNVLPDLRYAVRALRRSPGFTAGSILILALGIGANTAIFSVVRAVLLRPLPFREPGRLAWVWATRADRDRAFYSIPNFRDTKAQARAFEDLAGFSPWGPTLSGEPEPERLSAVRVTGNAFAVLGARPAAGRAIAGSDAEPEASRVAVISHGLWQRRFAGDPGVVGRSIRLNGEAYAVVGVLPKEFLFPGAEDAEVAVPLSLQEDPRRTERGSNFLRVYGRLEPGADAERAQAELAGITAELARLYPDTNAKLTAPRVLPLAEEIVGGSKRLLLILSGAVGLLLLVASANLASLAFVRGLGRRHEVAIRKALGAGGARLIAPSFLEAALVAAAGAAAGLAVARAAVPLLLSLAPASIPRASDAMLDGWVLAFTAAVAVGCAILCGIGPAIVAARAPAIGSLARYGGSIGSGRTRRAFVLAQVALSLTLLSGAGLLAKSLARAWSVDPGFAPDHALAVHITLVKSRYPDTEAVRLFFARATARLEELPEVASAAVTSVLPLSGMNARTDFHVVGRDESDPARTPGAQNRWVDAHYFATLGIPLRRGRAFTERDDARGAGVAVVDEALASGLWPGEDPLGARLRLEDSEGTLRDAEVVGVVGRVKHFALEEDPLGTLYLPVAQIPGNLLGNVLNNSSLVVRTTVDPLSAAPAIRKAIRAIDPDVPTGGVRALEDLRSSALAPRRFLALLFAIFAAAGALLAGTGLYGALAQLVAQERRAIGVRLALGASRADILRLIARQGVGLTLAGVAVGLLVTLPLSRLLSGSLFGISSLDPASYGAASLLLVAIAAVSCGVPALRASRVDPTVALRSE
jgi:putative ABC transport system permease protein